jgi:dihydroorotase
MIIQNNVKYFTQKYGQEKLDASFHPLIRSAEACYQATARVTELANRYNTRLHLLHISTQKEVQLLQQNVNITLDKKKITAETCVHFLWFADQYYKTLGNKIKWNPAVKTVQDRNALRDAVNNNVIDVVATDHAPHLSEEKQGNCLTAASGAPMVQHSLVTMLELAKQGVFTKEKVVETMAHRPAQLFRIDRRGFIRPGYYADLVLVDPNQTWTVNKHNLLYHCQWSPLENQTFSCKIVKTFVNGTLAYDQGNFNNFPNPLPLKFSASQ